MVGHHVAQRAGRLVEVAARLDADGFGHRDLHVIDAVAVPDRLEQAVGKAQRHDVLHRFLAEEMIDADRSGLRCSTFQHALVQRLGRGQIVAERLLDDHAAPAVALLGQAGLARAVDDRPKETIRDRQVEQRIAAELFLCRAC